MTPIGEEADGLTPAGFWRRVFAGLCDGFFLLTVALALLLELIGAVSLAESFGWASPMSQKAGMSFAVALGIGWWLSSTLAWPIAYFTLCEGASGQTLGKHLFGIVVVGTDGHPIGYGRALARLLTLPYSLLPAGLGLLWVVLPPHKRAWHDYISATRVIAGSPATHSARVSASHQSKNSS